MKSILLSIQFAKKSLSENVGRTLLTLSGIIIGTLAVIMVLTLGDVLRSFVLGEIDSFGTDVIQVEIKVPSTDKNSSDNATSLASGVQITTLKQGDGEAIEDLPNVVSWYGGSIGQELVNYREVNKRIMLFGASFAAPEIDPGIDLSDGSFYSESQERGLSQVVVLGHNVKDTFFGNTEAVGESVKINGQSYRVIGVLKERGSTGFVSFDDFVYVPLATFQKKIAGIDHMAFMTVKIRDVSKDAETAREIEAILRDRHDIRKEGQDDFAVTTIREAKETVSTVLNAVEVLLLVLASISLVVGGVGIMNVMFSSVTERTGEIGLRKALGARSGDVLRQFLIEALALSLAGGLIGIVVAEGLLWGIGFALPSLGFDVEIGFSWRIIGIAVGFALSAGLIFGMYPAWKASGTSPIRAIREA